MKAFKSEALQGIFNAAMAAGKVCSCKRDLDGTESLNVTDVTVVALPDGRIAMGFIPLGVAPAVIDAELTSKAGWVS